VTSVSSVTAFLARALTDADPQAAALLTALDLDAEARAAVDAQAVPAVERRQWMAERTGREWTQAQFAHVEARTFVAIRRQLQARGLWLEP
jgi:hypothetical protein